MSWSHSFNGKTCCLSDSQHRIALKLNFNELNENVINRLTKLQYKNYFHIFLDFEGLEFEETSFISKFTLLQSLKDNFEQKSLGNKFIISMKCSLILLGTRAFQFILSNNIPISVLIICLPSAVDERTIELLNGIHRRISDENKINNLQLGLYNIESEIQLDWILSKLSSNYLKFIHLGLFKLPNIRNRCIELIYNKGLNVFYDFNMEDSMLSSQQSNIVNDISAKYEVSVLTAILKVILQLGIVITIPFSHGVSKIENEDILEEISRLVHSFVYRKSFVSTVKVVSLHISNEDVDRITKLSDEVEALTVENNWIPHVKELTAPRLRTY